MPPFVKFTLKEPLGLSGTGTLPLNSPTTGNAGPDLAKLEHQNESMAVTIPHPGVI